MVLWANSASTEPSVYGVYVGGISKEGGRMEPPQPIHAVGIDPKRGFAQQHVG